MCEKCKPFKVKLNKRGIGKGWRVFRRREDGFYPLIVETKKPYFLNQWLFHLLYSPFDNPEHGYGFHVFKRWLTAFWCALRLSKDLTLKKVYFRNVIGYGKWGGKVILVEEMWIPKRRSDKP